MADSVLITNEGHFKMGMKIWEAVLATFEAPFYLTCSSALVPSLCSYALR
jgi:hypothetical protein